jgi:uncharacterized protein YbaA (DUF1428 family)
VRTRDTCRISIEISVTTAETEGKSFTRTIDDAQTQLDGNSAPPGFGRTKTLSSARFALVDVESGASRSTNGETGSSPVLAPNPKEAAMTYVDGFVLAVPTANREKYRKHASDAAVVFKEHGALKFVECWGDDVPEGKVTSFPMAVKLEPGETVVFSWVIWPSREVRDEGMKKVMADPRLQPDANPMPFDGRRMIYGGFETIVDV